MSIRAVFSIVVLFWVSGVAAEQLYRWVDEDGNTQFSNRPPPAKVEAETLKIDGAGVAAATPDTQTESEDEEKVESEEEETEGEETEGEETEGEAPPQAQTRPDVHSENCKIARRNLDILNNNENVTTTDEEGNVRKLTSAERQARKAQEERNMSYYCELAKPAESSEEASEESEY